MEIRVSLVHADGQQRVVLLEAFEGERFLAGALGEAASAEEAEDRAMDRLRQRLQIPSRKAPGPFAPSSPSLAISTSPIPTVAPLSTDPPEPRSAPPSPPAETALPGSTVSSGSGEPEDWSADLSRLDRLLADLRWGREEERIIMQRLFGHPSRSRLTRHADLMVLRRALEGIPPGADPQLAPLPLSRAELLEQCDGLLLRLGWSMEQARQSLETRFAVVSRQHLTDDQLLAFNLFLESEILLLGAESSGQSPA